MPSRTIRPGPFACHVADRPRGVALAGTDIFISYSSADRAVAHRLAERFEADGLSVWWDAALYSGQTFDEVIEAELRAARVVVVLWSPRSVISRWVRAEATIADRHGKLVPAIIEPCERPIIFELTHTADLSRWNGDAADPLWMSFVQDVRRTLERQSTGEPRVVRSPFGADTPAELTPPIPLPRLEEGDQLVLASAPAVVLEQSAVPKAANQPSEKKFDSIADEFHCLEQQAGSRSRKRYVVSPAGLRIGRTPPADIVIPDSRVSRVHCLVELADDRLQVSDLNSTNGTFIDGRRIHGRAFLNLGATLQVGDMSFHHKLRRRAEAIRRQ